MTREEQIKAVAVSKGIEFKNNLIKESVSEGLARMYSNIAVSYFEKGAKYADETPDEKMIAKYLYEKKGYPIDLNGNLSSFEDTMKDVELYNKYKKKQRLDKAIEWIDYNNKNGGCLFDNWKEDFRNYMEK